MLKVYIADDEKVVRQGLKNIIDWGAHDFEVCGEAGNGLTAYNEIKVLKPDLLLIDIRMPKLQGLDLASQLREEGFDGHIIVLSGYSEFKYAQEAIRCDVDYYLTKPIEEDELVDAVSNIRKQIQKRRLHDEHLNYYQEKARDKILEDIIKIEGKSLATFQYSLGELNLHADEYQVLILQPLSEACDAYSELCKVMKVPYRTEMIELLSVETYQIVLLKGELVIGRFDAYKKEHMKKRERPFFIAVGSVVSGINDIYYSYHEALMVFEYQFFLEQKDYIGEKSMLPKADKMKNVFTAKDSKDIGRQLYEYIVIFKKKECEIYLKKLKERLTYSSNSVESIKSVLAGMYIYIMQEFKKDYVSYNPQFLTSAEIIQWIHGRSYLQEILEFIQKDIERMIQIISGFNSEGIVDEIMEYLKYHYNEDIKLKNLAPKFGYNNSYLGKIFSKKTGISFNDYLHKLRTEKAKELLLDSKYKIYEISTLVGYKNVDYFHLKFKQFEDCTPNEYRIANHITVES